MKLDEYKRKFDSNMEDFERAMQELAERVHKEVMIPACRKHRMGFMSGMGTFFFTKKGIGNIHDDRCHEFHKLSKAAQVTVRELLVLLDMELSHAQHLGYLISDVEEQ